MAYNFEKSEEKLYETILSLESIDDCKNFFADLCTIKELHDMAQRLDAAFMLDEGKSYTTICKETGMSTTTIGRVSRCLNYGANGYRTIIDRSKK